MRRNGPREWLRRTLARLLRPGLVETEARLWRLETMILRRTGGVWRGGIEGGLVHDDPLDIDGVLAAKLREELTFWRRTVRIPGSHPAVQGAFEEVFGAWQRERLRELGEWLGMDDEAARAAWRRRQSVVEIGGGPYPAVAAAGGGDGGDGGSGWRRAVVVDPLADGFAAEGLLPRNRDDFVYLCATGEYVPLPSGQFDLVICENCLDHANDPGKVLAEAWRLLRGRAGGDGTEGASGLLWLLVDLMDHPDALHPQAMDEARIKGMVRDARFEVVRERVSGHKSHPEASGEYRGLLRKRSVVG